MKINPARAYRFWRKARQYPKVGQVIRYHDTLVRVRATYYDRDMLDVRWYDGQDRHDQTVSWTHCCELP